MNVQFSPPDITEEEIQRNLPTAFLNRGVADMDVAHYEEQMGKEEN